MALEKRHSAMSGYWSAECSVADLVILIGDFAG
jgi:hypothetical protein